ncbi:hypothetical protein [Micromonospora chersina]|uniref:hypothetical protein n=1 Tax=Micromonospora chersina TaxID=47854 RepID=UPI003711C4A6
MNAIMEPSVRTCRRELLDRTLIWNQRHLLQVLREFEIFYTSTGRTRASPTPDHSHRCQIRSPIRTGSPTCTSTDVTASAASFTSTNMPPNGSYRVVVGQSVPVAAGR